MGKKMKPERARLLEALALNAEEYLREYDTPAPDLALRIHYRDRMKRLLADLRRASGEGSGS